MMCVLCASSSAIDNVNAPEAVPRPLRMLPRKSRSIVVIVCFLTSAILPRARARAQQEKKNNSISASRARGRAAVRETSVL